jgi:hypothetical protein
MKFLAVCLLLLLTFTSTQAQEAPVIVNSQTGTQVNLVRAYWDPNIDIANRVMQCDFFAFNEETLVYEERPDFVPYAPVFPWFRSSPYYHLPLPEFPAQVNSAFIGTEAIDRAGAYLPLWSMTNGVYDGIAPLVASEFVELVAHLSDTINAVRVWHSTAQYHVCYDPDGEPMVPTGQPGVSPQLNEPVDDLIVTFGNLGNHSDAPVLIDRETGLTIEFTTGRWNYNRDIALRRFGCASFRWDDTEGRYLFETWPDNSNTHWYHPYNGGDSVLVSYRGSDGDLGSTTKHLIEDDSVHWFAPFDRRYLELTDSETGFEFRHWGETNDSFRGCSVALIDGQSAETKFGPSLPLQSNEETSTDNGDATTVNNACDYTDAEDYDGWGWNSATMTSCPPQTDDLSVDEPTGTDSEVESANNAQSSDDNLDQLNSAQDNSVSVDTIAGSNESPADTELDLSVESTSKTGGGSIWLPLLMLTVAFRHVSMVSINRHRY